MPKIDERTREQIAVFLPTAIESAIQSYQNFSKEQATAPCEPAPKDDNGKESQNDNAAKTNAAQNFKQHHDACKVAIAHIELLLKLAQWAEIPEEDITQGDLAKIIIESNASIGRT